MRPEDRPLAERISDPFEPEPAPPGSYLDAIERESRQQARRRGDGPLPGRAAEPARSGVDAPSAPRPLLAAE